MVAFAAAVAEPTNAVSPEARFAPNKFLLPGDDPEIFHHQLRQQGCLVDNMMMGSAESMYMVWVDDELRLVRARHRCEPGWIVVEKPTRALFFTCIGMGPAPTKRKTAK